MDPGSRPSLADPAPAGERRCLPRPRRVGDLRPTDLVSAFFVCAIAFLLAAAAAGVLQALSPWPWGRWLALHLAFVGGVSQLVLGASQFFVGAFLATDPPPRALVRGQLLAWNTGAVVLAIAMPMAAGAAVWGAVALLLAGLALWGAAVATMSRRSLRRSVWATNWYASAAAFLGLGVLVGSLLAHGTPWAHGNLLAAHLALNLGGWFGAAIVGTLHTFFPSLTQTRLRYPRLQPLCFVAWTGGVSALAVGYAWTLEPLALAGWFGLCLGALMLLINIGACLGTAPRPLPLPARLVGAGQPFLLAGLGVATVAALDRGPGLALVGPPRAAVGTLLVVGWIGLTVVGSLLHLLAVVVRVRAGFTARMPDPRPRLDLSLTAVAATGIALLALSQRAGLDTWRQPGELLLLLSYSYFAARITLLAGRLLARARPSL